MASKVTEPKEVDAMCPFGRAAQQLASSGFVKRIAMKRSVANRVWVRFRAQNHVLDFLGEGRCLDSFGQWLCSLDIGYEHLQGRCDRFGLFAESFDIASPGHYVSERTGRTIRLPVSRLYSDQPKPS